MKKMSYIDLINRFWDEHSESTFSPEVICLFFRLLDYSNKLYWPESFRLRDSYLCDNTGLDLPALKSARNSLKKRQQIAFIRNHNSNNHTYSIPTTYAQISDSKTIDKREKVSKKAPVDVGKRASFKKDNKDKDFLNEKIFLKNENQDYYNAYISNLKRRSNRLNPDPNDEELYCR